MADHIRYNFEYDQRIRAGFVGCGGHAWRNVFPTFQYAPVELVAGFEAMLVARPLAASPRVTAAAAASTRLWTLELSSTDQHLGRAG